MRTALSNLLSHALPPAALVKVARNYSHLANWIRHRDWWFPQQVQIEISVRCNRECFYCPNHYDARFPDGEMSMADFELVMQRLREIRFAGVVQYHTFNEPMLVKSLGNMIAMTHWCLPGAMPTLTTNGDCLTRDKATALMRAGMVRCNVSRHAPFTKEWDRRVLAIIKEWPHVFRLVQVGKNVVMNLPGDPWRGKCLSATVSLVINWKAQIVACCCDHRSSQVMGDLHNQDIAQVWFSEKFEAARRRLRGGERVFPICQTCQGIF